MSMLSAQCDELRSMAESVGLEMPKAATLMMEAADTIERLCEQAEDMDFQLDKWQTKAEYFKQLADLVEADNAKLREEFNKMDVWHSKELTAAMAENTKLRKLVRDMMEFFEDGDWCVKCERALDCQEQEQYEDECLMRFVFRDRMRELGIEVDE